MSSCQACVRAASKRKERKRFYKKEFKKISDKLDELRCKKAGYTDLHFVTYWPNLLPKWNDQLEDDLKMTKVAYNSLHDLYYYYARKPSLVGRQDLPNNSREKLTAEKTAEWTCLPCKIVPRQKESTPRQ